MTSAAGTAPVSVVIPCYRCSTTIGRAVESILRQTLKPAEIILVDDASEDGTLAVLQQLAGLHHGWIRVLQLDMNHGAASARNAGWEAASQPYIAFLDSDDSWHPEKLRIQYEYMLGNPDVAISGHRCIWLRNGELQPDLPQTPAATKISAISLIFRNSFSTPSVMLKRNIPFRFPDKKRYGEDVSLWQQIAFSGLPVVRLEYPLAYVHKALYGDGGLSAQLWKMEKGELDNFIALYRSRKINGLLFVAATGFSLAKYIKRLVATNINRVLAALR